MCFWLVFFVKPKAELGMVLNSMNAADLELSTIMRQVSDVIIIFFTNGLNR